MLMTILSGISCSRTDDNFLTDLEGNGTLNASSGRLPNTERRNVLIIYSLGFNNLSSYLKQDIDDIANGPLPSGFRSDDIILVFSHNTKGAYSVQTSPVLTRLYRESDGTTVRDTVMVLPESTISASAETLNTVLEFVKESYPAANYGMLMSSHATGWIPAGYSSNSSSLEYSSPMYRRSRRPVAMPYVEEEPQDGMPMVKSFGVQTMADKTAYEMDITDMAEAIPMKMDYIIFDACFMGSIEVAYELRDVCDLIAASQTEILAEGMVYETLTDHILRDDPDLEGFCREYYDFYNGKTGVYRSATISLVDCRKLDGLAQECRKIFSNHREGLAAIESSSYVQKYWRSSAHKWFYDLESIAINAGATQEEIAVLHEELDRCVIYKAATPCFMEDFDIDIHSGFSMYLPYSGRNYLNSFYKTLKWNKATGLVE